MRELGVERAWVTECDRCVNEGSSDAENATEARAALIAQGWERDDDGWTYCPPCNGRRGR